MRRAASTCVAMALALQVTSESDIRVRNLETDEDRRITDGPNARQPDVSGDVAVWSELGSDGNWGIVIYDLANRSVIRRVDRTGNQQFPAIAGRRVVWQDNRRGNWDIRAYDLDERREFAVSDSSEDETRPAISGDLVAFERDDQIWYRDLATGRPQRIDGYDGWEPAVSGDRIVFRTGNSRDDERNAGIYVFDRTRRQPSRSSARTLDSSTGQARASRATWSSGGIDGGATATSSATNLSRRPSFRSTSPTTIRISPRSRVTEH